MDGPAGRWPRTRRWNDSSRVTSAGVIDFADRRCTSPAISWTMLAYTARDAINDLMAALTIGSAVGSLTAGAAKMAAH